MSERVQKIIAKAGICSRRKAEELIVQGRVKVNGKTINELGVKADPLQDEIKVDGEVIHPLKKKVYIMLNKPTGVVTTKSDEKGRETVMDLLVSEEKKALFPVGRLDLNSEGLLLITNDGDFADLLTSPSHKVEKTYLIKVRGVPAEKTLERLRKGIFFEGRKTRKAKVTLLGHKNNSWLEITISEGRNNQIRKMMQKVGHPVVKLKRVKIGNLELGDLPVGKYRKLKEFEVNNLIKMALEKQK